MFTTVSPNQSLRRALVTLPALAAVTLLLCQPVLAQQCNLAGAPNSTLRTPLIPGAPASAPLLAPPEGEPPACGDGATPAGVIPGMGGSPTLLPWVPNLPSSNIAGLGNTGVPIPFNPAITSPPGTLGPALAPAIPPAPSTPGSDPGSLTAPMGSFNPAQQLNINPGGGIPGEGGFCTTIPTARRGGQSTTQWELRGRNSSLGGMADDGSQDQVELLGPMAGYGVPFGVPTGNGMRNSSIDLGGGQRFTAGGSRISTGSTLQDYGNSAMRYNPTYAIQAQQSTEFGQGLRRIPTYSSKSTDFGFPYTQFDPANVSNQKRDHLLLPTAVITNF